LRAVCGEITSIHFLLSYFTCLEELLCSMISPPGSEFGEHKVFWNDAAAYKVHYDL
jgi:hypothetical protein